VPEAAAGSNRVHRRTVTSPVGLLSLFEEADAITGLVWSAGKRIRNAKPSSRGGSGRGYKTFPSAPR
jgi:hypothetical protein